MASHDSTNFDNLPDNDNDRNEGGGHIFAFEQIVSNTGKETETDYDDLPILPTRDLVLFPGVTFPITLGRERSAKTAQSASDKGIYIGIVCQRDPMVEEPTVPVDLYRYGVFAKVIKLLKLPDGRQTALVTAGGKFKILGAGAGKIMPGALSAAVKPVKEVAAAPFDREFSFIAEQVKHTALELLRPMIDSHSEMVVNIENTDDYDDTINRVATNAPISPAEKIEMLGLYRMKDRAFALLTALSRVSEIAGMVNQIKEKTSQALSEQQRSAFLQQQLEVIRQELYGAQSDDSTNLRERAAEVKLTDDARKMFNRELDKLQRLNPQNPDYMVAYNYLDHLLGLPWGEYSPLPDGNVADARACLEKDHYGLEKVKERIVEQLAVMLNNPEGNSPIICLVGPPGVGKTSLGKSIAAALGRKYQRVSLGGMHDESELRGHRRTYIGAMPGRIIDAIHRAGTANPVLLLDEIDKMSSDYKGDPAAAMLEVLDPEQNSHFHDNYTDVDFDLSKVLFITTANTLSTIQQPLLDRMEVIDISGYLLEEKVEIARRHLLPRLLRQLNFENSGFEISDSALEALIEGYTSESGVRQLEKQLASLVRKAILAKMSETAFPTPVEPSDLEKLLGVAPYTRDRYEGNDFPGVATGLAWTPVGGEILYVETSLAPGKEGLTLTGSLGNVMKESASIALQYVKAHADDLGIDPKKLETNAVAIHVPEGAIPKDGPSAGVTMITSIVSALTGRKVTAGIAMTGEITLRGKVLAVGGIKEKILAAKRAGISTIVLPAQNRRNIAEIPERYVKDMTFHYVDNITELLDYTLS